MSSLIVNESVGDVPIVDIPKPDELSIQAMNGHCSGSACLDVILPPRPLKRRAPIEVVQRRDIVVCPIDKCAVSFDTYPTSLLINHLVASHTLAMESAVVISRSAKIITEITLE